VFITPEDANAHGPCIQIDFTVKMSIGVIIIHKYSC